MKNRKLMLLASVACAAITTAPLSRAMAFDDVDWEWNKTITENVVKDVNIQLNNTPSGMIELEKTQVHIGDATAVSNVSGVYNDPPAGTDGGIVNIDDTLTFVTKYSDEAQNVQPVEPVDGESGTLQGTILNGSVLEGTNDLELTIGVSGTVPFVGGEAIDAVDLPEVVSSATAVGNNQSIASDVSVDLHDGQFLYGGYNGSIPPGAGAREIAAYDPENRNFHDDLMLAIAYAGAIGAVQPAQIGASSTVSDIHNASVDSDATAVGNNLNVDLSASTPADALLIGDVTQLAYADVGASSIVEGVGVSNYANMAALDRPLVNSSATAIGNNASFKISAPDILVSP
ncbi:MAG: hypothetical protein H6862_02800 [Rhodospirillales bacterium]|nr:hypothetical protein [Rhodospirillales bacterium]